MIVKKASTKPVYMEFITYEDLKELANGRSSFEFKGHPITKERGYIIPTPLGSFNCTPSDVLLIDEYGNLYVTTKGNFERTYD